MSTDEDLWDENDTRDGAIYSSHGRESLIEDDEITIEEEAFMQGYEQAT